MGSNPIRSTILRGDDMGNIISQHKSDPKERMCNMIRARERMADLAMKVIYEDAKKGIKRDYSCAKRIGV